MWHVEGKFLSGKFSCDISQGPNISSDVTEGIDERRRKENEKRRGQEDKES